MEKFAARKADGTDSILVVRVELVDSQPPIWRQLEIRGSLALNQVHQVLQAAFGWEDAHLHRFTPDDPFAPLRAVDGEIPEVLQWLPGQECEEPGDRPEEDCSLDQLLALGSGGAYYEYDFGDSWLHRLELVSRRPAYGDSPPARLIDGARRGPLEDSGGFPGYEEIMDALADPSHPDHAEYSAWALSRVPCSYQATIGASRDRQRRHQGFAFMRELAVATEHDDLRQSLSLLSLRRGQLLPLQPSPLGGGAANVK